MKRNVEAELDALKVQMTELHALVRQLTVSNATTTTNPALNRVAAHPIQTEVPQESIDQGGVYFSGQYQGAFSQYRWEPQERRISQLLDLDGDKVAKVLSVLGHRQRLDILRAVMQEPLTGAEIVERLNMGTTGQLYHHIKALLGADLLVQEERGGKYTLPERRALPLLLLFASSAELLDTSDYMELAHVREDASGYLGSSQDVYDPHLLLRSVIENTLLEHQAGYCSEVSIILHEDGSVTVVDNGRGIPVVAFAGTSKPHVQAVLTELHENASASIHASNRNKGINIPVVNALSEKLSVEVRREGKIYRQDYKHGIPQSNVHTVGLTRDTGTSITFLPDRDIFRMSFDRNRLAQELDEISAHHAGLALHFLQD
ncbi:helix-turn-helix domain-containing protein [Paenibacillus terrigena]|uniref:helix-turn-helix domain-containing protein n=1 Tax=Paenibacillus terrigena TaxID=369333 RepID=UPI000381E273|nr:helix-turn-helix domain-containing protein [Paenibacillus terrigena]